MRAAIMLVNTKSNMDALHPKKHAPDSRIVVFCHSQVPSDITSILKNVGKYIIWIQIELLIWPQQNKAKQTRAHIWWDIL